MLTVFTRCANCDEQVTVDVSRNESVSNKYYCTKCCASGTVNTTALVFAEYNNLTETKVTYTKSVKSAEEKALDELKEFCLKGE